METLDFNVDVRSGGLEGVVATVPSDVVTCGVVTTISSSSSLSSSSSSSSISLLGGGRGYFFVGSGIFVAL